MHKFVRSLLTEWRRLGLPGEGVLVLAVSGGGDSVAMLLAFAELKRRKKLKHELVAAHFDHGLRGEESRADAKFVERLADELAIDRIVEKGKVARRGNLEQNARLARYEFLQRAARQKNAFGVATAHTVNDQAETLLMNLIRGAGPDGLAAMPPVREMAGGQLLVRPLLRWAMREETEAFCREMGVSPREDAMNEDLSFTRVKIRKQVIPLLIEINPRAVEALANTAALTVAHVPKQAEGEESLRVAELSTWTDDQVRNEIREWLRARRGNLRGLTLKHIEGVVRLVKSRKSGRVAELPRGERVTKRGGRLVYDGGDGAANEV